MCIYQIETSSSSILGNFICCPVGPSCSDDSDSADTKAMYFKAELSQAKEAYAMIKNTGNPSLDELVKMVENGNIL